ncbi:MAG: hypothetical protein K8I82_28180 [Anaerolineae bacterium]|nr:hypothetical protein [Anaerolineae bacterium]
MAKHYLESGEYLLGHYKVQPANWSNGEWFGNGQWLRAMVTNRRLLIASEPQRYDKPEAIAPTDILRVWNLCLGRRDGVMVVLRDGRRLYMLVDWSQGNKLVRDINEMIAPPLKPHIIPRLRPQ